MKVLGIRPGRNRTEDLYKRGLLVKRTSAVDFLKYHSHKSPSTRYEESEGIAKECCRSGPCSYHEMEEVAEKHSWAETHKTLCEVSIR